jgi:phosphoglycolate phosphatase-like HAD superfamily hydrolase
MKCYLFDLDGTLADLSHRLPLIQKDPKDWDAFFAACGDDAPISHIIGVAQALMTSGCLVFVSGRSDAVRPQTEAWLFKHGLGDGPGRLYMRKAGDHRPDNIVKGELLDQILAAGFRPVMAFEDRDQVVKMWRERGIPCAQVADGNF